MVESPLPLPPRLVPDQPLPAYTYVPGKRPHPIREAAGHSYGRPPDTVSADEVRRWWECRAYLWGIDLFHYGYYWEAHESWEAVWMAAGRRGNEADFLKGLIKLAAALVKGREGMREGVARHARRAAELFALVLLHSDDSGDMMGLSLASLIAEAERMAAAPERLVYLGDEPVVRLTPLRLVLRWPARD